MTAPKRKKAARKKKAARPPTLAEIKTGRRKLSKADRAKVDAAIAAAKPLLDAARRITSDPMLPVLNEDAALGHIIRALDEKAAQARTESASHAASIRAALNKSAVNKATARDEFSALPPERQIKFKYAHANCNRFGVTAKTIADRWLRGL
jgi:hypothetical protein